MKIKSYMIKKGARFYDEFNGRYITVTDEILANINAIDCMVEEFDDDGNIKPGYSQLFTIRELDHFRRCEA